MVETQTTRYTTNEIEELLFTNKRESSAVDALHKLDKGAVWHPFTQMKDWEAEDNLMVSHAEGNYIYSVEGQRLLDGISSLWVNVLGHSHPKVTDYLKRQMERVMHTTMLGQSSVPATLLAGQLVSMLPDNLTRVFYSDNGSTAAEIALKMCYQARLQQGQGQRRHVAPQPEHPVAHAGSYAWPA